MLPEVEERTRPVAKFTAEGRSVEGRFPRRLASLVVLALVGMLTVGCVPYQKYKDTVRELDRAKQANADLIKKYNQLHMKTQGGGGGGGESDAALLAEINRLKEQLETAQQGPAFNPKDLPLGAEFEKGGFALGASLLFDQGRANLKSSAYPVLDQIVDLLQTQHSQERIIIEGHTDVQPLKNTLKIWQFNMNLAYNRALAVFKYLQEHGVPESRMILHAYSFNRPVNEGTMHTKDGQRRNRRVVVRRTDEIVVRENAPTVGYNG